MQAEFHNPGFIFLPRQQAAIDPSTSGDLERLMLGEGVRQQEVDHYANEHRRSPRDQGSGERQ